jgi:hypothetical protein
MVGKVNMTFLQYMLNRPVILEILDFMSVLLGLDLGRQVGAEAKICGGVAPPPLDLKP